MSWRQARFGVVVAGTVAVWVCSVLFEEAWFETPFGRSLKHASVQASSDSSSGCCRTPPAATASSAPLFYFFAAAGKQTEESEGGGGGASKEKGTSASPLQLNPQDLKDFVTKLSSSPEAANVMAKLMGTTKDGKAEGLLGVLTQSLALIDEKAPGISNKLLGFMSNITDKLENKLGTPIKGMGVYDELKHMLDSQKQHRTDTAGDRREGKEEETRGSQTTKGPDDEL